MHSCVRAGLSRGRLAAMDCRIACVSLSARRKRWISWLPLRRTSCVAEPLFRRLALIGIGLIGSSVGRIAKERGDIGSEVVVNARTARTLERVRELSFADSVEADVARAVAGADCVMLCAPVGAFAEIAAAIAPHLAQGA